VTWHIWTDGSCINRDLGKSETPKGGRGYGGWAAIIEHGSDGFVLRGRENATTNVRMELVAVIEGLRAVPTGDLAVVHTDSTVILSVLDRWQRGDRESRGVHSDLWADLMACFDRLHVKIELVVRGKTGANERDFVHQRAHLLAGAEAKAQLHIANGRIPPSATPLNEDDRRILGDRFKRQVRAWRDRQNRVNGKALPSSR
jgi:ribonuclease HI